jgi:hypothetical protein
MENIYFSTVDRQPAYLHQTLTSLLISEYAPKINLVMDDDKDFLPNYNSKKLIKHLRPAASNSRNQVKAAENYNRCLFLGKEDCLICEDDIVFHHNWFHLFDKCLKEIYENTDGKFILSIAGWPPITTNKHQFASSFSFGYRSYCQVVPQVINGASLIFNGSFALYYSKGCWLDLTKHIVDLAEYFKYDMAIGSFCSFNKIPIFATILPLVKHVGEGTSI